MSEIAKHNSPSDVWIVVNGYVIDVTRFLSVHPGGDDSILAYSGKDCSSMWNITHEPNMIADSVLHDILGTVEGAEEGILQKIGLNETDGSVGCSEEKELNSPNNGKTCCTNNIIALSPDNWTYFKLIEKVPLTSDVFKLKFELQSAQHVLGLAVGQHVSLQYTDTTSDKQIVRSYTPTSSNHARGYVEFCVKVYHPLHPRFPEGGKMSQYLDRLRIGDSIEMKGPKVRFTLL